MKRWPPYGKTDGTEWHNGNPATGERGSIIDCRAIAHSQSEIVNAISRLGLTPAEADLEQLGKAISNAIAAATGGGDTSGFVTMETARARLPFFPEIVNDTGILSVTSPSSGTLYVPATDTIRHRGVFDVLLSDLADVDRTFNLLPNKVAHLRWSAAGGLERFYLDDAGYNPSGLPEAHPNFDSSFDSALLARVVTDINAAATITPLQNLHGLAMTSLINGTDAHDAGSNGANFAIQQTLNWARTPANFILARSRATDGRDSGDEDFALYAPGTSSGTALTSLPIDRYGLDVRVMHDDAGTSFQMQFTARA